MTIAAPILRNIDELEAAGLVAAAERPALDKLAERYAVAITPAMAALIDRADADDPIARQFVPSLDELDQRPGERADPIGDRAHSPVEGIVHRYPDRALLKLVSVCAVYCRFCFRREMVGPGHANTLSEEALAKALAYVRSRPEIWEVIVTGGDPFMLSPRRLHALITALGEIPHVKVIRFHTRVPVVAPERITDDLVAALLSSAQTLYVALHANHPREFTDAARAACARLAGAAIPLLGQTVLLRGINDDADILASLMRAFVEARVKPYYLHHADLAPGTAHFRTTIEEGQRLMRALQAKVSGLCLPTYVLDIPGGFGKVPIGPSYLEGGAGHASRVQDPAGLWHSYPNESSSAERTGHDDAPSTPHRLRQA